MTISHLWECTSLAHQIKVSFYRFCNAYPKEDATQNLTAFFEVIPFFAESINSFRLEN